MKTCSDRVLRVPRSGIREIFDLLPDYPDAVNLCIGEPDFTTPSFIIQKALRAARQGATHYTPNAGLLELREQISKKYEKEQGIVYAPKKEVLITVGAMEALFLTLMSTVNQGEKVLLPDPSWPNYEAQVLVAGGKPVFIPTKEEEGWVMKPERIKEHLSPHTKAIILNTPSNPTGCVYQKEELEEIANIANQHDLIVIFDECYEKILHEGKHHSIASFEGMREKAILINSFSKTYAMTGWRVGYALGDERVIAQMTKLQEDVASCASSVSQKAALEALISGEKAVEQMVNHYRRRRSVLLQEIERTPLISCLPPKGAFYAFVNVKKVGAKSRDIALRWLKQAKVATVPGSGFGKQGEGYLRVSFSTGEDKIRKAFKRIRAVL